MVQIIVLRLIRPKYNQEFQGANVLVIKETLATTTLH